MIGWQIIITIFAFFSYYNYISQEYFA
jgi:hypothetical protein